VAASSTDSAKPAQGRTVISLPKETGEAISSLGQALTDALFDQTGVSIEFTPSQVVQSVVQTALDAHEERMTAQAAEDADEDAEG
jgi:ABC-type phosphate/phosphonate transport system substrate-binding protein